MALALFAGIPVRDFKASLPFYEAVLGGPPSFLPYDTEAVWELGESRSVYIVEQPERAGHAINTIFADDLDAVVDAIIARGIEPAERETYSNGVRKVTYRDADGNELGFAGVPASTDS